MTQTIDLLLALAREGQAPVAERTALLPMVEKAVALASQRFPASPMAVIVAAPVRRLTATVAPALAQLVLNNLVGNAFQHAAQSQLTISADGDALIIADTGPGLTSGAEAFAPFVRGEDSGGSGLGLAIVQRLCAEAGIGLAWRSSAGDGTEFRLTFPQG
jgi:signal transduction histidine kinase